MPYRQLSEAEIAQRLALAAPHLHTPETPISPIVPRDLLEDPPRPASVLVPFLQIGEAWHLLFTRRTDTLPEHRGQVAFPGGRADAEDRSPEDTALREAFEETGLNPERVKVLGRLNTFITNTNYLLTPVVGAIPWPYSMRIEAVEVQRVFTIPLEWLADPSHREVRQRQLPPPFHSVPVIYFQEYDGELLWGVSAFITVDLLDILFTR
jgi:8-oxo-dGTP pyrophosphatase MutT (NUDIX family)